MAHLLSETNAVLARVCYPNTSTAHVNKCVVSEFYGAELVYNCTSEALDKIPSRSELILLFNVHYATVVVLVIWVPL